MRKGQWIICVALGLLAAIAGAAAAATQDELARRRAFCLSTGGGDLTDASTQLNFQRCMADPNAGQPSAGTSADSHRQYCLSRHFDLTEPSGRLLFQHCMADPNAGQAQPAGGNRRQFCLAQHYDLSDTAGQLMFQRCMAQR